MLPKYSRSRIQKWIKLGFVKVEGKTLASKDKVYTDQFIVISALLEDDISFTPESIPLEIIYADQDLIIINKPPGLVTHPGAGNRQGTLLNALVHHYPELAKLPRAGIVHRLDKDTSGVMVVARNLISYHHLVTELQERKIKREYLALVNGQIISGGTITANIGRHPQKRTLMTVTTKGKPATTHYRIIKRFNNYTYLRVSLETGRTHQIRVHLSHLGYPIIGDPDYNKINTISAKLPPQLREKLAAFKRQALHATYLELLHPNTNKLVSWEVKPPQDFIELLDILLKYNS